MTDPRSDGHGAERAPSGGGPDELETLRARVAQLEDELRQSAERASATRHRLERELDRSGRLLRERERAIGQVRGDLTRLQNRKVVRLGLSVSSLARQPVRLGIRAAAFSQRAARKAVRTARQLRPGASRPLTREQLVTALRAALPPAPEAIGTRRISIVVDSRTHPEALRECLESIEATQWEDLEVFVAGPNADNMVRAAYGDQRSVGGRRRVRPVTGGASDSRREAMAIATGDLVLLMHDDVAAIEPTWLGRMAAALAAQGGGAVGARLLLTAGGGDKAAGARGLTNAHVGLEFRPVEGLPLASPIGLGTDPLDPALHGAVVVPAATEACLLVERAAFDAVGLPPHDQELAEPVELCLRLRQAGLPISVERDAVLFHRHPVAEREHEPELELGELRSVHDRWGPALVRAVLLDRMAVAERWSMGPLRVGITLMKDDESAGYGDWYTAHELGGALAELGWSVSYLERYKDRWYEAAAGCDVVVSLLQAFDLFQVPRGVVSVAWIRNWTEEWTAKPWFDNYDIVLVSSGRSKEVVEAQSAKVAHVFPIATNPARFSPRPPTPGLEADAVFVGSHWGVERGIDRALPTLAASGRRVAVYGRGWDAEPAMAGLARGLKGYDELVDLYASSSLAIDDAAISTKPYGSVNSRVFDALATGALVVTDNELGVRELFDDDFPVWHDADDLGPVVDALLADPQRRAALADRYRRIVLDRHTYAHRATELRAILEDWVRAPKVAAHIGPQTWEMGRTWGDVPFGRDVQRQLERRGHPTAVLVHDEQGSAAAVGADVALHIFGVRAPRTMSAQLNALWVISHPDRVTESLCEVYDVVFTASDLLLEHLRQRIDVPLVSLHQATEPSRFFPDPTGPRHQLLFVGNSRGVRRPIIDDLRDTPWDLAVYGGGWTADLVDPSRVRGEWVSNDELRRYYSSAEVVLNDHWGDMRDLGIISNRVYDALACGAFVVSDRVPGIDEEFDGAVATYETRDQLLATVSRSLADPEARRAAADRGRAAVLARHTFAQRVERILAEVEPRLRERDALLVPARPPVPATEARRKSTRAAVAVESATGPRLDATSTSADPDQTGVPA